MKDFNYLFFRGRGNPPLAKEVLKILGEYLGKQINFNVIDFSLWGDKCPNDRIINYHEVRGRKVVLFDSLSSKEAMFDFLTLSMALRRQYGAESLLAVLPFLLVRRCDHEEKPEEIHYLKLYLDMLSFSGVTDLIACTPHSDAMAKNCQESGIDFSPAYMDFSRQLKTIIPRAENTIVFSPDKGSIPRAIAHAKKINAPVMFTSKLRKLNNETEIIPATPEEISEIIKKYSAEFDFNSLNYIDDEKIKGANIIIIDDEMSTGGTSNMTARMLKSMFAKAVYLAFCHPVCSGNWKISLFDGEVFTRVLAGDTIIRDEFNRTGGKIVDVSTADVIATAIYQTIAKKLH